jgi:hypothetical protein
MTGPGIRSFAERELKYQVRREIARGIRDNCPRGDPIVTAVCVMLGSILAMAAFSAILDRREQRTVNCVDAARTKSDWRQR